MTQLLKDLPILLPTTFMIFSRVGTMAARNIKLQHESILRLDYSIISDILLFKGIRLYLMNKSWKLIRLYDIGGKYEENCYIT